MPRPNLKDRRSSEILDACLSCVARYGLDGATLERIAREAGVKRPLLRHYLGNRDEMMRRLAAYVVAELDAATQATGMILAEAERPRDVAEWLLSESGRVGEDRRLTLAWQALAEASDRAPEMRQPLIDAQNAFLDTLYTALARLAPGAGVGEVSAVAQGLASLRAARHGMQPLDPRGRWEADLRQAAIMLAARLERNG